MTYAQFLKEKHPWFVPVWFALLISLVIYTLFNLEWITGLVWVAFFITFKIHNESLAKEFDKLYKK